MGQPISNDPTRPGAYTKPANLSDSADLTDGVCRGFTLGVSGNVKITYDNGTVDTLVGLAAGIPQPYQARRIWSTGTTASSISVIY